jgi:2-iminobutanoate/2-iminopropanoate deaminase
MRKPISTPGAPPPIGPYSQGMIADKFVYTAEEGGATPDGKLPPDVAGQTNNAISSIEAILKGGGCTLADAVQVTVFLANLGDFAAMNAEYGKRFPAPYPVRSIIQTALPEPGAKVAMSAIAIRGDHGNQ